MVESIITKRACIYCNCEGNIISIYTGEIKEYMYVECPYCDGTGYEKDDKKSDE